MFPLSTVQPITQWLVQVHANSWENLRCECTFMPKVSEAPATTLRIPLQINCNISDLFVCTKRPLFSMRTIASAITLMPSLGVNGSLVKFFEWSRNIEPFELSATLKQEPSRRSRAPTRLQDLHWPMRLVTGTYLRACTVQCRDLELEFESSPQVAVGWYRQVVQYHSNKAINCS